MIYCFLAVTLIVISAFHLKFYFFRDYSIKFTKNVTEVVLETFICYVDEVRDGIAYITIESQLNGDVLYGQYPESELASKGIYEQNSFLCETIGVGKLTRLDIKPLPPVEITSERLKEIDEMFSFLDESEDS